MTESNEAALQRNRQLTRRSFLTGGIAAALGAGTLTWLTRSEAEDGIPWPFRRVLEFNERVSRAAFRDDRLAPQFALSAAAGPADARVNGLIGLRSDIDVGTWTLTVESDAGAARTFTYAQLRSLPRTTWVTELKCIEGWSQVMAFSGVSFRDFLLAYGLGTRDGRAPDFDRQRDNVYDYCALETPDRSYYVGLERDSFLHPQTLLCDEMGGEPLSREHGAPLRLAIPVKYGIKNIKRIGRIRFTDSRPADYWAQRGYDWYAGH